MAASRKRSRRRLALAIEAGWINHLYGHPPYDGWRRELDDLYEAERKVRAAEKEEESA